MLIGSGLRWGGDGGRGKEEVGGTAGRAGVVGWEMRDGVHGLAELVAFLCTLGLHHTETASDLSCTLGRAFLGCLPSP